MHDSPSLSGFSARTRPQDVGTAAQSGSDSGAKVDPSAVLMQVHKKVRAPVRCDLRVQVPSSLLGESRSESR